jgi:hypothetical protein
MPDHPIIARMTNRGALVLALPALLTAPAALAEPAALSTEPDAGPAPTTPTVAAPVAARPPAGAAPGAPDRGLADRVRALELEIAVLRESDQAQKAALASAARLEFSGYVQGRYEWHDGSTNGATFASNGTATAANQNRFMVRHGQLAARYHGTYAEYFLRIDANTKEGIGIKDVYAAFIEPWTPLRLKLLAGQFRYPFGYEVQQSDADREMPERALIERFFFDGQRDRGLRLEGRYNFFNFAVALVNGTVFDGTKNLAASKDPAPLGSNDPNEFKDWVGRLGIDLGFLVGGVSGYFGKGLYIRPPVAATDTTPGSAAIADSRYKYRFGADLRTFVPVPSVGLLALQGEVIYGKDTARPFHGVSANPCRSSATWGFILTAVQHFARDFGAVVHVEMKDTLASSIAEGCATEKAAAQTDRIVTTGGGLLYYASANLKLTVTYEHPTEQGASRKDNDFAMGQLQARFR